MYSSFCKGKFRVFKARTLVWVRNIVLKFQSVWYRVWLELVAEKIKVMKHLIREGARGSHQPSVIHPLLSSHSVFFVLFGIYLITTHPHFYIPTNSPSLPTCYCYLRTLLISLYHTWLFCLFVFYNQTDCWHFLLLLCVGTSFATYPFAVTSVFHASATSACGK